MLIELAVAAAVLGGLAALASWDVSRRGGSGELVALGVFFVLPLGLALWFGARRHPAGATSAASDGTDGSAPATPTATAAGPPGCPVHRPEAGSGTTAR